MHRYEYEQIKHQHNIESITSQALSYTSDHAKHVGDIDDDWITFFFDKARLVSDEQMQTLWARLLAGEADRPGSISRRTIEIVSALDKEEAHAFTRLCGYAWLVEGKHWIIVLRAYQRENMYKKHQIDFETLAILEEAGLLNYENSLGVGGFCNTSDAEYAYFDRKVTVKCTGDPIDIGVVKLTSAGEQLCALANPQPVEGFFEYVIKHWQGKGFSVFVQ